MSWFTKSQIESTELKLKSNLRTAESFKGTNVGVKYAAKAEATKAELAALYLKRELEKRK